MNRAATPISARRPPGCGAGFQPAFHPRLAGHGQAERLHHNSNSRRSAFTLTEVLVIITVIVLVLAMAVPLFNVFSTTRSVDAAQNVISAALQRTRARAIGLQEYRGLFFFTDPANGNVSMMTVLYRDAIDVVAGPPAAIPIDIDYGSDEIEPLPTGVGIAFLGRDTATPTPGLQLRPLGLIVFDPFGRVEMRDFAVRKGDDLAIRSGLNNVTAAIPNQSSQLILFMYDKKVFAELDPTNDPAQTQVFTSTQSTWINPPTNAVAGGSTALVVNRYNGTLFRGE